MTLTFATGCSGIGAPEMAWGNRLGWKCLWCSEIEPFPSAVLAYRWPETPNLGDFMKLAEKIEHDEIEAPDVFIAGTPCQAFSMAGLRKSLNDHRGGLTLEYCRIADAMDEYRRRRGLPETIFVWENVPGVFSTKDNAFGCFIAGLTGDDEPCRTPDGASWPNCGMAAGCRRQLAWRTLDAQFFGVAQRRRRVFVVCTARAGFSPAGGLFECGENPRYLEPSRKERETASCTSENRAELLDSLAYCIGNGQVDSAINMDEEISQTLNCMHDPTEILCFENHAQDSRFKLTGNMAPILNAKDGTGGGNLPVVFGFCGQNGGDETSTTSFGPEISPTLRTSVKTDIVSTNTFFLRSLTTVECARLQGFPDHHTEIPWRGKAPQNCPKGRQYKAYGNSMCVNVIEWLGRMIEKELENPSGVVLDPPPEQLEFDF